MGMLELVKLGGGGFFFFFSQLLVFTLLQHAQSCL